jgi:hypothetical protein
MPKFLFKLSILFLLSFSIACAAIQTHTKIVRKKGFEALELPRNCNGEGTIFHIDNGREILMRDPDSCLPEICIKRVCGKAFLPSCTEKVETAIDLMNFVKDVDEAELGLKGKNIKKIKITFRDAFIKQIPVGNLLDLLRNGKISDPCPEGWKISESCVEDILKKENYLIVEILGVEKMVYEFMQEKEMKIGINDVFVLNTLGIEAGIKYKIERNAQLVINTPCYIGYKAVKLYKYLEVGPEGEKIIQYTGHEIPQENMKKRKETSLEKERRKDRLIR